MANGTLGTDEFNEEIWSTFSAERQERDSLVKGVSEPTADLGAVCESQMQEQLQQSAGGAEYCEHCEKWLNGPKQMEDHKLGKRHKKKLARGRPAQASARKMEPKTPGKDNGKGKVGPQGEYDEKQAHEESDYGTSDVSQIAGDVQQMQSLPQESAYDERFSNWPIQMQPLEWPAAFWMQGDHPDWYDPQEAQYHDPYGL